MTHRKFAAAITLAIVAQTAPRAEWTSHVAAVALSTGNRHHYTISGRVRPLLFWIGKDDIGDAVITRQRDTNAASYALLIGSDPDRAPRGINRWGYISEEVRGTEATLVGLMTESDEASVDEAEANLRSRGDRTFNVIHGLVAGGEARSVVRSVAAPSTLTLRQVDTLLELADRNGRDGQTRVVRLPEGSRPGFLTALADLLHAQATDWRSTGKVHPGQTVPYVYHGKSYQLRATHARAVASAQIGVNAYDHLIESQFQVKNATTGVVSGFSLTYAADGPLAEIPIAATYQPHWWIEIHLTLDDTKPGPLPPVEISR
jgi:hypothetical protein